MLWSSPASSGLKYRRTSLWVSNNSVNFQLSTIVNTFVRCSFNVFLNEQSNDRPIHAYDRFDIVK
jgi:hypothetical protein